MRSVLAIQETARPVPPSVLGREASEWPWHKILGCGLQGRRFCSTLGAEVIRPDRCGVAGCPRCDKSRLAKVSSSLHWYKSGLPWHLFTFTSEFPVCSAEDVVVFLERVRATIRSAKAQGWWKAGCYVVEPVPMKNPPAGAVGQIPCPFRVASSLPEDAPKLAFEAIQGCRRGCCPLCGGGGVLPIAHVHLHVVACGQAVHWVDPGRDPLAPLAHHRRYLSAAHATESNWGELVWPGKEVGFLTWAQSLGWGRSSDEPIQGDEAAAAAAYVSKGAAKYVAKGSPLALYAASYMRSAGPRVRTAARFGDLRGLECRRVDPGLMEPPDRPGGVVPIADLKEVKEARQIAQGLAELAGLPTVLLCSSSSSEPAGSGAAGRQRAGFGEAGASLTYEAVEPLQQAPALDSCSPSPERVAAGSLAAATGEGSPLGRGRQPSFAAAKLEATAIPGEGSMNLQGRLERLSPGDQALITSLIDALGEYSALKALSGLFKRDGEGYYYPCHTELKPHPPLRESALQPGATVAQALRLEWYQPLLVQLSSGYWLAGAGASVVGLYHAGERWAATFSAVRHAFKRVYTYLAAIYRLPDREERESWLSRTRSILAELQAFLEPLGFSLDLTETMIQAREYARRQRDGVAGSRISESYGAFSVCVRGGLERSLQAA